VNYILSKLDTFVLSYAIGLIVAGFVVSLWAYLQYRKTVQSLRQFRGLLSPFEPKRPASGRGLPLELLDSIRASIAKVSTDPRNQFVERWWKEINDSVVPYAGPSKDRLWYLGRPAEAVLDAETVIEPTFNQRFIRALPALMTSAGLLGTFIAILLALLDLNVDVNNNIAGIPELISNLSGKFVTSIIAIAASILLSGAEHFWFSGLRRAHVRLLATVNHLLPQLDEVIILRDVEEDSRRRTVSVANISSEVVDRFQSVFTTVVAPAFAENVKGELGPVLDELRVSMNNIREALQGIQKEKQESVVGEFRNLASGLENTLRTTLEQMGRDFRTSLSGSTSTEFDKAARALGASAQVLSSLNDTFAQMKESLDAVVTEARRATAEQLSTGAERANSLNQLVEQLLVRLDGSATKSAQQIQSLMAQSVEALNKQVEQLSVQMSDAVARATSQATDASHGAIAAADEVARHSREDAVAVTQRLEQLLGRMEAIGESLGSAQMTVRQVIGESAKVLKAFEDAGAQLRISVTALAGTATTAKEAQDSLRTTLGRVTDSVVQIGQVTDKQHATLERQMGAIAEVERVFDGLDEHLGSVLGEITERLQQHNQAIQQNFETILSRVNTEIPRVSNALGTAAEELSSNVEDLTDVIQRLRVSVRTS
jgi:hypothetical protein